ncbi:MAG: hypothetical protein V4450_14170 [Bacteroidota bacterium]
MKKLIITACLFACISGTASAQDNTASRTPEELKELFGFCDKTDLIAKFKLSAEQADKVGEIDYWARLQQKSIDANTNEVYATAGELQQEVTKRYKAFLSADQVKSVTDYKKAKASSPEPCEIIVLSYNHLFDTITPQRALLLYKTPWRKQLIDKLQINGRQADMLFETEVWKQKESLTISAIPETDFNRIRRTVAMNKERDSRYKAIGLSEDQMGTAIQFFKEHQLGTK